MSFPRYPKYKDSGVEWLGEVPAHWDVSKMKWVAKMESGHTPDKKIPEYWENGNIPWVSLNDTGYLKEHDYISNTAFQITELGIENSSAHLLPARAVVFSRDATIGRCAITTRPMAVSQHFIAWICGGSVAPEYLLLVLRSMTQQLDSLTTGATLKTIGMPEVRTLITPVPPLEEQEVITAFLSRETAKIDALVAEQQRLTDLLKEKRQAVISHAVTKGLNPQAPMKDSGVEWLGEVPTHWEVRRISALSTKITNGYVGPTRDIFVAEGIRYLQSLHIKNGKIRFDVPYFVSVEWSRQHSKSILEVGDVLIVQTGDIGQSAVVAEEFVGCNCHALIIVSPVRRLVEGDWIALVLKSEFGFQSLLSIQTGALHPHLNCGDVKDVSIPVPPLEEQRQIVKTVSQQISSLDGLISEAEQAIDLLQERRTALISAAVTGQIDVRALADRVAA